MKTQYTVNIDKVNRDLEIDISKFPEATQEYWMAYGIKRAHNDRLAGETLAAYREMPGNANATEAQFKSYINGLLDNMVARFQAGDIRRGGGGKKADELLVEMRAILAKHFGWNKTKAREAVKSRSDVEFHCRTLAEDRLKATGQKYAKQNVDYGADKILEQITAQAQSVLDNKAAFEVEVDVNDWK